MNDRRVPILDPDGRRIELPVWVIIKLTQAKFLVRDQETGLQRIKPTIYGFRDLFAGSDPTRPRAVRAYDYRRPRGGNHQHPLMQALERKE